MTINPAPPSVDLWAGTNTVNPPPAGDAPATEHAAYQQRIAERIRLREVDEYIAIRAREQATDRRRHELAAKMKAEAQNDTCVQDGASFLLDVPETPPTVWGRGDDILWAKGEALVIAGPQGVGKTTLAGQVLAGSVGVLDEVLGYPVAPSERRTLYLAMDRPQQAARNLARVFRGTDRALLAERLRVWTGPPPADFAVAPETLIEMCRQHDADRVFIDSLKDAAVGLSKDEVGAGYNRARQMAIREGVDVVELHHQRKAGDAGGKPTTINDVYGSVWITSGAGSVILLWGQPGDPLVEFHHLKQVINVVGPFDIEHDAHTGLSTVRRDESKDLVALARRVALSGLSAKDAAAAWFAEESPDKGQVAKARRELMNLVKKGLLQVREPDGSGRGAQALWFPAARAEDAGREPEPEVPPSPCPFCRYDREGVEHVVICLWNGVDAVDVAESIGVDRDRVDAIRAAYAQRKAGSSL